MKIYYHVFTDEISEEEHFYPEDKLEDALRAFQDFIDQGAHFIRLYKQQVNETDNSLIDEDCLLALN